jgi:hypothetical protein
MTCKLAKDKPTEEFVFLIGNYFDSNPTKDEKDMDQYTQFFPNTGSVNILFVSKESKEAKLRTVIDKYQ